MLFLPRGYWHGTHTLEDSMHVVVQDKVPSWSDILFMFLRHTPLLEELGREPVFEAWSKSGPEPKVASGLAERLRALGVRIGGGALDRLVGGQLLERVRDSIIESRQVERPT